MDAKVQAVLDAYHERIQAEHDARPGHEPPGGAMLAVGPETGRLINILARSLERPTILEIGTSYGYSGVWLAEAARASRGRLVTMEIEPHKSAYAREMSEKAGLADVVDFRLGDAVKMIQAMPGGIDFVLLDLWKDLYVPCLEAFYPKLNPGAIIVADNMIYPGGENIARYARAVRSKPHMTSILVPVGSGLEISRYEGPPR